MSAAQHQIDAMEKAQGILREHFPAAVIVVADASADEPDTQAYVTFFGGYFTAAGLIEAGRLKFLSTATTFGEDEEDDGEEVEA